MSKRTLQCLEYCPLCPHSYVRNERRCLGARDHDTLHQCKKHAWGTLIQRGQDLENVSRRTGSYLPPYQRRLIAGGKVVKAIDL